MVYSELLMKVIKAHETAIKEQGKQIIHIRQELIRREKVLQTEVIWLRNRMNKLELTN